MVHIWGLAVQFVQKFLYLDDLLIKMTDDGDDIQREIYLYKLRVILSNIHFKSSPFYLKTIVFSLIYDASLCTRYSMQGAVVKDSFSIHASLIRIGKAIFTP